MQLSLVNSAIVAWSRLKDHFETKSLKNKLFLRRRFFTIMMGKGNDVLENIKKAYESGGTTRRSGCSGQ